METCNVVLTFESVDEILWRDHSNKTFLVLVFHGTFTYSVFNKIKFEPSCGFLF